MNLLAFTIPNAPDPILILPWLLFWIVPAIGIAIGFRTQIKDRATHTDFFGKPLGYTTYNTGRYEESDPSIAGAVAWLIGYPIVTIGAFFLVSNVKLPSSDDAPNPAVVEVVKSRELQEANEAAFIRSNSFLCEHCVNGHGSDVSNSDIVGNFDAFYFDNYANHHFDDDRAPDKYGGTAGPTHLDCNAKVVEFRMWFAKHTYPQDGSPSLPPYFKP